MENEVVKTSKEEVRDLCIEKMNSAENAEDFERFTNSYVKVEESINEEKKTKSSTSWLDPKFLLSLGIPLLTMILSKLIDRDTLQKQNEFVAKVEEVTIPHTSAGKGLLGTVRMPSVFNKGDH